MNEINKQVVQVRMSMTLYEEKWNDKERLRIKLRQTREKVVARELCKRLIRSIVSSEACEINRKVIERLCKGSFDESYGKTKQCIKEYESVYQKTLEVKGKTEVTEL